MLFQDYLNTMPSIEHLQALEIQDLNGKVIHTIPAIEGKLGSLKLYHALAQQFSGSLNADTAKQGLIWFAEHVIDAQNHPNKHPNIDLLHQVIEKNLHYQLIPIIKENQ